jgi:t-SNARE complex subunit (syntaxin)
LAVTSVIQGQAQDIGTEIGRQNKMLDNVADDIDKTNTRMVQIDNNMKRLMAKANQKMCWGVLCCEIVLLIVLLLLP